MRETDGPFFPVEAVEPGGRGEIGLVAEIFAWNGFAVIPCRDFPEEVTKRDKAGKPEIDEKTGKEKKETKGAKTPHLLAWQKKATSSVGAVRAWWGQWPTAMLGVPTGAVNGFWVLDVDLPKKPGDADGRETLRRLEAEHGPLPTTPKVGTPSGGVHFCWKWTPGLDEVLVNRAKILPGLDVRCTGGYVIAPWSVNAEEGRPYVLLSDPSTPLAEAPAWLIGLLRKRKGPSAEGSPLPAPVLFRTLPGEDDWDSLARRDYADALEAVRTAPEGERNQTLNDASFGIFRKIRTGKIPEREKDSVWNAFRDAAGIGRKDGLEDSEIERTLKSAWDGSGRKPLTAAEVRSMNRMREWRERREFQRMRGAYSPAPPEWADLPPVEAYAEDAETFASSLEGTDGTDVPAADARPVAPRPSTSPGTERRGGKMDGEEALKSAGPVVAVLTVEEARAFREDGVPAIALLDAGNVGRLISEAERAKRTAPIVYHSDGSPLCKALDAGFFNNPAVPSCRGLLYPEGSTALDAAASGPGSLREAVRAVTLPWREEVRRAYIDRHSMGAVIDGFLRKIAEGREDNIPISTGFPVLDRKLDGGLYKGLYVLGAIPSNGKTTLALQIADNLALAGREVLFFSYETEREDLMARSVSRWTRLLVDPDGTALDRLLEADPDYPQERIEAILAMREAVSRAGRDESVPAERAGSFAKTARKVSRSDLYRTAFSRDETALLDAAIALEDLTRSTLFVRKVGRGFGVDSIRRAIEEHVRSTGSLPVVFVDYVQRVAPFDPRATDKQRVDDTMEALQEVALDFGATVFGISSFNRISYSKTVAMEAFKESGGIEFSADVMLGLQLAGVGKNGFDVDEAKRADPRKIELVTLKNRNGPTGEKMLFDYYARFNLFVEGEG